LSGDQASTLRAQTSPAGNPPVGDGDDNGVAAPPRSWRQLWQVPTVLISTGLIVLGLTTSVQPPIPNDFDGALAQVEAFMIDGQYDLAGHQLRKTIEPSIKQGTPSQQASFHALAADFLFLSHETAGTRDQAVNRQVLDQYAKAVQLGLELTPVRLERSTEAFLAVDETQNARNCLAALDALCNVPSNAHAGIGEMSAHGVQGSRNRVFRLIVQHNLHQTDLPYEDLMRTLADYRQDPSLTTADEVWAVARQAELRLDAGFAAQAVDALLVEMRRLETSDRKEAEAHFGELYVLLGRGYIELREDGKAGSHLQRALDLFVDAAPAKGFALLQLGEIAQSRGDLEVAQEHFELVILDFVGTPAWLPALLGRAEIQSLLGEHGASQTDYQQVVRELGRRGAGNEIDASRVVESLCDRHDALLALGDVKGALDYVSIAETLFKTEDMPQAVLIRLASTNRQLAMDLVGPPLGVSGETVVNASVDPSIRHEANTKFERAADCYLQHANAQTGNGGEWQVSLWAAADSYDLAGRQDLAIAEWDRYLGIQPIDDPRRVETLFRLAQAHHARAEHERAATAYSQVIQGYPRSDFAAQSFVPMARCQLALERVDDAKQTLADVLTGDRLLKPDARDYREALAELARLHHAQREFTPAIERFTESIERYPDDSRLGESRFLLADSYRQSALAIRAQIEEQPSISTAESDRMGILRDEQFEEALRHFAAVETSVSTASGPSESREDLVRRSQLYAADCAFYLRRFEQAVAEYDQAARRYSSHHSSMYALIQIVNCFAAMGDSERLTAAHHRALVRLKQLPEDVFQSPDSLMDRGAWERWLENTPVGLASGASADASPN